MKTQLCVCFFFVSQGRLLIQTFLCYWSDLNNWTYYNSQRRLWERGDLKTKKRLFLTDIRGASRQGFEVRAQENSIITLTNGRGGDFKPKVGKRKTRERKMTHMVQSSVSLMESINNLNALHFIVFKSEWPYYQSLNLFFFSSSEFFNQLWINVKQMFGNTLMISSLLSLRFSLPRSCHQDEPAASLLSDGCACFI